MARCKECIHFDVCYLREIDNDIRDSGENPNCLYFSPTADVVEVVRCKDCVWWEARTYGSTIGRCENPHNGLVSEYSEHTDFCNYGERKE